MIIKLKITKTFEYDTKTDESWLKQTLEENGVSSPADPDEIRDAIRTMLDEDMASLVELDDIDSHDFEIEVPKDATLEFTQADEA